ncbi:MAG: hypothetical protein HYR51_07900 [Candidatus Rokubacteria bacterium]|nr:hypothetical protein [Candidatus Rokubacteria bacterium]
MSNMTRVSVGVSAIALAALGALAVPAIHASGRAERQAARAERQAERQAAVAAQAEQVPPAWADVRAFGAIGDGQADDTQAFKRALASGLPVRIPTPKTHFVVQETLKVSTGQMVAGVGRGRSIVKFTGSGDAFVTDPDADRKTRDISFRDFTLMGTGNKSANGIVLVRTSDPTVEDVQIRDIGGIGLVIDGSEKGGVSQSHYAYVHNLHVIGTHRIGVQLRGPATDQGTNRHRFFFLRVSGSSDAALDIGKQSSTSNFFGFSAENVGTAIRIAGRHNFFYGMTIETASGHGVEFIKGTGNNRFVGTTMSKVGGSRWANAQLNAPLKGEAANDPDFAK